MLSVIVNPSGGGGRAGRALPDVRAALDARGLEHHVERTTSIEHARELAPAAADGGEIPVALGGAGILGAVAGALKHTQGGLDVPPGGPGNDFARARRIPLRPGATRAL